MFIIASTVTALNITFVLIKLWPSPPPPFLTLGTEAYVCVLLLFFWIHKLLYTFIGPDVIVKPFLCNYIWLI